MNGMERLTAAIDGTPSDRIPIFCNLLDQGAQELGMSIREYYSSGEHVATGQILMREKYGYDNVWSLFYVGREAELFGCRSIIYAEDGPPNVGEMIIRTLDDIEKLQPPVPVIDHPLFAEELTCLRILRRELGGRYPICAYITSTMTLPVLLMGMGPWFSLLLTGPDEPRRRLLEICHRFFVEEVRAFREGGADIILYSNPFGSTDFVPPHFFQQFSLPWIKRDIEAIGTSGVVFYCGSARMNDVIDTVIRETGIGAYYPSPLDDPAQVKRIIAGRGLCSGVINDIPMIDWTPERVRQEVRTIIEAGKPGGKFLFGTLVMPYRIPEENIRALMDAAIEFGSWEK